MGKYSVPLFALLSGPHCDLVENRASERSQSCGSAIGPIVLVSMVSALMGLVGPAVVADAKIDGASLCSKLNRLTV